MHCLQTHQFSSNIPTYTVIRTYTVIKCQTFAHQHYYLDSTLIRHLRVLTRLLNDWKPVKLIFPCSVLKRLVVFLALTPKIFLLEMWLSFCSGLLSWFPHSVCIGYWYWHLVSRELMICFHESSNYESTHFFTNIYQMKKGINSLFVKINIFSLFWALEIFKTKIT